MSHTLVICEKPSAAKSIAEALAEDGVKKHGEKEAYYEFERNDRKFFAAPAVGHLFTLKQTDKGWYYPILDKIDWAPTFEANKFAKFTEPYFRNIEKLAKEANDVIIATDYDDEGEVIGYNILRFICGRKDAARMKFNTMTEEELVQSYEHMEKMNKNLIEAGLARHFMDFYWGISLTRALTLSIKAANKRFRILSTGRVQGPTLHFLAKHEKQIKSFVPDPFWEIEIEVTIGKKKFPVEYAKGRIWSKSEAEKLLAKIKNTKNAVVHDVKTKILMQQPPVPYNTTALLADIYRYFGYTPQQSMGLTEVLYQAGLISYPRTSSEKLPADINYKKILTKLSKQAAYAKDTQTLLSQKQLKPNEGKKTDAAHPAVYPTGEYKKLGSKHQKVYDLIVRRFMATFGEPAKRESQRVIMDINGELFALSGIRTIEPGWTTLYGNYSKREEIILPNLKKDDKVAVSSTSLQQKETQPPARYSQGSVLKEMEEKSLGTKATRAQIMQILYNRGYVIGNSIEVTELGMQLSEILEKNVPDVISEKLTKHFEEMTESIETGKIKHEAVLEEVKKELIRISDAFRKKEKKIGEELTTAVIATQDKQSKLGPCPSCKSMLKVHKNCRTGKRFVGCSGYPKGCRTGFPLPREGLIMSTDKMCDECKTPIIQVRLQGRRPFRMCLDPVCPTKSEWLDKKKLKEVQAASRKSSKEAEKLKCPECSKQQKSQRALTLHAKSHKAAIAVNKNK